MRISVRIADIQKISPTVKSFALALDGKPFTFLPGQWIDCFIEIDGLTEVAGYSMTSSPTEPDWFSIAVKRVGDNPVTDFIHDHAKVGDTLMVEGGSGDFHYTGSDFHYTGNDPHPLALIAGGIGITPIASIVRYIAQSDVQVPTTLIYSAATPFELLFRQEFETMASRVPNFRTHFTVTQPHSEQWNGNTGRITATTLRTAGITPNHLCYICGPPEMIQAMLTALKEIDVPEERLQYEQWW